MGDKASLLRFLQLRSVPSRTTKEEPSPKPAAPVSIPPLSFPTPFIAQLDLAYLDSVESAQAQARRMLDSSKSAAGRLAPFARMAAGARKASGSLRTLRQQASLAMNGTGVRETDFAAIELQAANALAAGRLIGSVAAPAQRFAEDVLRGVSMCRALQQQGADVAKVRALPHAPVRLNAPPKAAPVTARAASARSTAAEFQSELIASVSLPKVELDGVNPFEVRTAATQRLVPYAGGLLTRPAIPYAASDSDGRPEFPAASGRHARCP